MRDIIALAKESGFFSSVAMEFRVELKRLHLLLESEIRKEFEERIAELEAQIASFDTHHCESEGCAVEGNYSANGKAFADKFQAVTAQNAKLMEALEKSPHSRNCGVHSKLMCDCWKSMQADAERYKFLRRADIDAIGNGGLFVGKTPENIVMNGSDLDAAIDAALTPQPEKEGKE